MSKDNKIVSWEELAFKYAGDTGVDKDIGKKRDCYSGRDFGRIGKLKEEMDEKIRRMGREN
jgi:hypothetical protein